MMYNYYPLRPNATNQENEAKSSLMPPSGFQGPYPYNPYPSGPQVANPSNQQYPGSFPAPPNTSKGPEKTSEQHNGKNTEGYSYNPMMYTPYIKSGGDMQAQLEHIQQLLVQLIQQNNAILQQLQHPPEQSQTVSTPSGGGAVIVRM